MTTLTQCPVTEVFHPDGHNRLYELPPAMTDNSGMIAHVQEPTTKAGLRDTWQISDGQNWNTISLIEADRLITHWRAVRRTQHALNNRSNP